MIAYKYKSRSDLSPNESQICSFLQMMNGIATQSEIVTFRARDRRTTRDVINRLVVRGLATKKLSKDGQIIVKLKCARK